LLRYHVPGVRHVSIAISLVYHNVVREAATNTQLDMQRQFPEHRNAIPVVPGVNVVREDKGPNAAIVDDVPDDKLRGAASCGRCERER
jgi:hypothetical protein